MSQTPTESSYSLPTEAQNWRNEESECRTGTKVTVRKSQLAGMALRVKYKLQVSEEGFRISASRTWWDAYWFPG